MKEDHMRKGVEAQRGGEPKNKPRNKHSTGTEERSSSFFHVMSHLKKYINS